MRESHTTVLERQTPTTGPFTTEPLECAWASEASFFVHLGPTRAENADLTATVQLSADGMTWLDDTVELHIGLHDEAAFVRVTHFGGWLRLTGEISGEATDLTVYAVLKE